MQNVKLFIDAYNDYLVYARSRLKKQGYETIKRNFNNHIIPYFKDQYIQDLSKSDIINWQTIILQKNFKNNFNRNLYYEFSAFIRYCIYCSYLTENIVLQVPKFPKKIEEKHYDTYNHLEFLWFRIHLEKYVYKQFFNFMFFFGSRPSEAMALRFSDLKKKYIYIRHNIERHGDRLLDTPKNQSSIRVIKIDLLMYFRIMKLKHFYKKHNNDFNDSFFIFGGKKPLSPTSIDRYKKRACKKAHIREITQHQFRHSYATRNIHKGVPIDYVSKNMGHSTVSMTVDTYLHQKKEHTPFS